MDPQLINVFHEISHTDAQYRSISSIRIILTSRCIRRAAYLAPLAPSLSAIIIMERYVIKALALLEGCKLTGKLYHSEDESSAVVLRFALKPISECQALARVPHTIPIYCLRTSSIFFADEMRHAKRLSDSVVVPLPICIYNGVTAGPGNRCTSGGGRFREEKVILLTTRCDLTFLKGYYPFYLIVYWGPHRREA